MCTMIVQQIQIEGSGKSASGWFSLRQANVSYDHPFDMPQEYTLNIDFVNEAKGPGARVAVELNETSARLLMQSIQAVLDKAASGGFLESQSNPSW